MTDNIMAIAERVATACHASNLRVHIDSNRGSQADVLIAMAWSKSRLGSALMRLRSEYDAIEKPRVMSHDAMVRLALTMHSDAKDPKERIKDMQAKAKAEADKWYYTEKQLFLSKLKTMPQITNQVMLYCYKSGIDSTNKAASSLVGYWLNQLCPSCNGLKYQQIPDSPALSAVACKACGGSGYAPVPHGRTGKMVLNYLDGCVSVAQQSISYRLKNNYK